MVAKGAGKLSCFRSGQRLSLGLLQELWQFVRLAGGIEAQRGSKSRAVLIPNLRHKGNSALTGNLCRWVVLSGRFVVAIVGDIAKGSLSSPRLVLTLPFLPSHVEPRSGCLFLS